MFAKLFGPRGRSSRELTSVVAHVLDIKSGYQRGTLNIGHDISAEVVEKHAQGGEIFALVHYEKGERVLSLVTREEWLNSKAQQEQGRARQVDAEETPELV